MPSPETSPEPSRTPTRALSPAQREVLLDTALASIEHGLRAGEPLAVDAADHDADLRAPRATFVTLRRADGDLRGCMGSGAPRHPLVVDVARNGYNAAFLDPRFRPLTDPELQGLHVHISVLSPLEPLPATSEEELMARVRPGVDGLVVQEGARRATLLPAVWESLPEVERFLYELRRKAGLPGHYWSETLRFERYTAESFGR